MPRKASTKKRATAPEIPEEEEDILSSEEESSVHDDELDEGSEEYESDNEGESEEEEPEPVKKVSRGRPAKKAVAKKAPVKKVAAKTTTEKPKRYFKIVLTEIVPQGSSPPINTENLSAGGGRYVGKNPMQAAKKAFTRISKASADGKSKKECSYVFSIAETTQTSAKKTFVYIGVRRELDEPQQVTKGDTTYPIRFESKVSSYKPTKAPVKKAAPKKAPVKKTAVKKAPVKRAPAKKTRRSKPKAK